MAIAVRVGGKELCRCWFRETRQTCEISGVGEHNH